MKSTILQIYKKYKQAVDYVIVGGMTTVVSLVLFYGSVWTILDGTDARQMQAANIVSWIGAVLFAYILNRLFVFKSKNLKILKELFVFAATRVLTLLLDMLVMFLGSTVLKFDFHFVKLISMILITAANYVISKFWVFRS